MTFGPDHYVPVLKVKRGEKQALTVLSHATRQWVTPLLEIVERKDKPLDDHLRTAFAGLADSVRSYSRCFLDGREISSDGETGAVKVFDKARTEGINFTPVTGIYRTADVNPALDYGANGIAIRLTRDEFEEREMRSDLQRFVARIDLDATKIDLILDMGPVDQLVSDGVAALANAFLAEIPDQKRWRTLTISGCAFPKSLGIVDRNSYELVERAEWMAWRDEMFANRSSMERLPTYSDCAIQHPSGVEGFDPRYMRPSAAIRYALHDAWLLIKGEGTERIPATFQFPQLATELVYGHLRRHYFGESHCGGCQRAKDSADGASGLGSAEVWRRLGTIHHVTTVVRENLAPLPWP